MAANCGLFTYRPSDLTCVLASYYKGFQKNPTTILDAIPITERWRFFIDLDEQSFLQQWTKNMKSKGICEDDFKNLCLRDFINKYDNEYPRDMLALNTHFEYKKILDYSERNLQDLSQLPEGWLPFEEREPGYLRALLPQLHGLSTNHISMEQDADSFVNELILRVKTMHRAATHKVKNLTVLDEVSGTSEQKQHSEFRNSDGISCGLHFTYTSLAGFISLLDAMKNQLDTPCFFAIGYLSDLDPDIESIDYIIGDEQQKKNAYLINKHDSKFRCVKDINPEEYEFLYNTYINLAGQYSLANPTEGISTRECLEKAMRAAAAEFYVCMKKDHLTVVEKLQYILTLIQKFERIHPFEDANTRTFSMLLMNELLMTQGFPPSILADPNRSAYYSIPELMQEVINGMQKTLELARDKTLVDEMPTEVILELISEEERLQFFLLCQNPATSENVLPDLEGNTHAPSNK